ncbi:nucleotidyltransferase domain-containing protein [Bdellovibrio sp.]|uniref:nucleotidyltransferase domain-containing protein n=1 Tax=Bdellovibrio sp. TaxID=28201 RepID=UPI0039E5F384
MKQIFSKKLIVERMNEALAATPQVFAAWLGGSTATGFEDELSDTDIVVICEDPQIVFSVLEKTLASLATLSFVWKVEESFWKGFSQKFYVLAETPETYYLDVGVFQSINPQDYQEFFNIERHGRPIILFDKKGILQTASLAPRYEAPKLFDLAQWQARFEILYRTFLKESLRGKYIDSFLFYQRLVVLWVQLLRHHQTPQKHDFGLRYIYRDFSPERAQEVEALLKANTLEDLQKQAASLRQKAIAFIKDGENI